MSLTSVLWQIFKNQRIIIYKEVRKIKHQFGLLLIITILMGVIVLTDTPITGMSITDTVRDATTLEDTPANRMIVKYLIIGALGLFIIVLFLILNLVMHSNADEELPDMPAVHYKSPRLDKIHKMQKELETIHGITNH